jgi:hypothetical protein
LGSDASDIASEIRRGVTSGEIVADEDSINAGMTGRWKLTIEESLKNEDRDQRIESALDSMIGEAGKDKDMAWCENCQNNVNPKSKNDKAVCPKCGRALFDPETALSGKLEESVSDGERLLRGVSGDEARDTDEV